MPAWRHVLSPPKPMHIESNCRGKFIIRQPAIFFMLILPGKNRSGFFSSHGLDLPENQVNRKKKRLGDVLPSRGTALFLSPFGEANQQVVLLPAGTPRMLTKLL